MPEKAPERNEQTEPLREALRREMREHMAFQEATEDTMAYTYAADALHRFAERGLSAANAVQNELTRQKAFAPDDPKRMAPEEIIAWERMLTEVETWTLSIPNLLQQSRVVQYDPLVREQLWAIFDMIHDRDQALDAIEALRFRALKGSTKNPFSPFDRAVPPEFFQLAAIATTQWFIRENIRIHPHLLDPQKSADLKVHLEGLQILKDSELEGEWEVEQAIPLDQFLRLKFGAAFFREQFPEQQQRDQELKTLIGQGRVRVNGAVEKENPARALAKGDRVNVVTVFYRATERVGQGMEDVRKSADEKRKKLNAERTTQNLPAAAEFAFNLQDSMSVWVRLLTEVGGGEDRKRCARQLREDIGQFRKDILEKEAFAEFKRDAGKALQNAKTDNAHAKKLIEFFTWFTGEAISDRLTTSPEEFQQVFDSVMAKVEATFDEVASPENTALVADAQRILQKIEKGETVENSVVQDTLGRYGALLLKAGRAMTSVQAWQTSENVQRVGGAGAPNNLELVTRIENKSFPEWAAQFSPYGAFKTTSYRDKKGRIIIADAGPSFSERSWSHIWETGKIGIQHAALSVILTHILTRIHYLVILAPGVHGIVKALGSTLAVPATAVIQAELAMYEAKEAARYERMKRAAEQIEEAVETLIVLKKNEKKLAPVQQVAIAQMLCQKLRVELTVLLHAAEGESDITQLFNGHRDTDLRSDLFMEAHLYTNQILMAVGFPPMAGLDATGAFSPVTSEAELRKRVKDQKHEAKISPELAEYIDSRARDEKLKGDRRQIADLRGRREEIAVGTTAQLSDLMKEVNKPKKSRIQEFIDGEDYPSSLNVGKQSSQMREAASSSEMDKHYEELTKTPELQDELLRYACQIILFDHEIKMDMQSNVQYKGKPGYEWIGWIPGPHQYIPAEYKGDQRHILSKEKKDAWNKRAQELIRIPMTKVLATVRYLEKNPPSNEKIAELALDADSAVKVQKLAGGTKMASEVLSRWALLRQYADKYAPPEKAVPKEHVLRWEEKQKCYVCDYTDGKVKAKITVKGGPGSASYHAGTLTHPSEDHAYQIVITECSDLRDWGESRTWNVWGASFFDNDKFPKAVRERILLLLTIPGEGKSQTASSLDRVLTLFPQDATGRTQLLEKLTPMYEESFRKQQFLEDLFRSIHKNGDAVTEVSSGKIYEEMRQYQELGMFGYVPWMEKRE